MGGGWLYLTTWGGGLPEEEVAGGREGVCRGWANLFFGDRNARQVNEFLQACSVKFWGV